MTKLNKWPKWRWRIYIARELAELQSNLAWTRRMKGRNVKRDN